LAAMGRLEDAVESAQRARELDPLSPTINAAVGMALYRAGHYGDAVAHLEAVRSLEPDFTLVYAFLGEVHLIERRYQDAVRALEKGFNPRVRLSSDLGFLGYAYAKAGRQRDAERLLRELEDRGARGYVSSASVAVLLTGLGDTVEAFRRLEQAADERDPLLILNFVIDPLLEGLRKEPRGQALLRRMGLPYRRSSPG
jgi:tetratricopeptide (TPR) repeat protein